MVLFFIMNIGWCSVWMLWLGLLVNVARLVNWFGVMWLK